MRAIVLHAASLDNAAIEAQLFCDVACSTITYLVVFSECLSIAGGLVR